MIQICPICVEKVDSDRLYQHYHGGLSYTFLNRGGPLPNPVTSPGKEFGPSLELPPLSTLYRDALDILVKFCQSSKDTYCNVNHVTSLLTLLRDSPISDQNTIPEFLSLIAEIGEFINSCVITDHLADSPEERLKDYLSDYEKRHFMDLGIESNHSAVSNNPDEDDPEIPEYDPGYPVDEKFYRE